MTIPVKEKQKKAFDSLKKDFGYVNALEVPRLEKIVVSTSIGSISDKEKIEIVQDRLQKISGQKPAPRQAKQSIASFNLRQGDVIGYQVTLRGARMESFLDKLIHVAIPRMKDFRGISRDSVDEMGNLTIGIPEHVIFPETSDEELKDIFGFAVTLVITAGDRKEAIAYFEHMGVPFKKNQEED